MKYFWRFFFLILLLDVPANRALSQSVTPFPYSARTMDYDGWTPATQSDINTTGIAGATIALPSSISAAANNPAGFAMEMGNVAAVYNQVRITDLRIQPDGQGINSFQWGASVSPPPWGFAITYYSPITEGASYISPNTMGTDPTEVSIRELRLTVSRTFFDSHLAIGASAEIVAAIRTIGNYGYPAEDGSYNLGILLRLPQHLLFGAGFAPQVAIGPSSNQDNPELPGFNRTVWRPAELDAGLGWEPNRFFKIGLQIGYTGPTPNTALLADQSFVTGSESTITPRLGESYVLANFKNFTSILAAGTYYETSRISGLDNRLHGTLGFEANPFFLNFGIGLDIASQYQNVIIGIGVDLVRTARFFDIIPADPVPPYNGFFPRATRVAAEGLPETMTEGEPRKTKPQSLGDIGEIIKEAPENIKDKFEGKPTTVEKKEIEKKEITEEIKEAIKLKKEKDNSAAALKKLQKIEPDKKKKKAATRPRTHSRPHSTPHPLQPFSNTQDPPSD